MSVVNLDYSANDHNNHLLKDIVWLLDTRLWEASLAARAPPGGAPRESLFGGTGGFVLLPQSRKEFDAQTGRDVNRLLYALVLGADLGRLYGNASVAEMHAPSTARRALPLAAAYPEWFTEGRLLFYGDLKDDPDVDLVCASRAAVGAKLGNVGHERVCRNMRQRSWDFYGVPPLPMVRVGQIFYPRPPRRVVVLQRHRTRGFGNLDELVGALRAHFVGERHVEVEVLDTSTLKTAEDFVRVFSRAGVLLTPHGSHAMGQIWMPRHSSLVEVMPVGYTDYAFNLLAESCKIWYYELQSLPDPSRGAGYYRDRCGSLEPHMLNPCVPIKAHPVFAPIPDAIRVVTLAMERMGHTIGPWLADSNASATVT